jgi:hypothetical protein
MANPIQYNDANFRALFPAFASTVTFPLASLSLYWGVATQYVCQWPQYGDGYNLAQQTLALNQMTAHLVQLNNQAATGQQAGIVTAASVGAVNVTLQPPPEVDQWQWWLNQTPYGQQFLALAQVDTVGGFYIADGVPARGMFSDGW